MEQPREWDGLPVASGAQLLHPHLDIGHRYWNSAILHSPQAYPTVIDATVGNGHDSIALFEALMSHPAGGRLLCCDVQPLAIERSQEHLRAATKDRKEWMWECSEGLHWRAKRVGSGSDPRDDESPAFIAIDWHCADHCSLLSDLDPASASLVVFNLGYLPGGDKEMYTRADTTVEALRAAERAVVAGGCVSATLYPGHAEGEREEEAVLRHAANLPFGQWSVHYTQWLNQRNKKDGSRAPSLCLMQRLNAGRSDGRRPQRAAPGAPLHAPWQG